MRVPCALCFSLGGQIFRGRYFGNPIAAKRMFNRDEQSAADFEREVKGRSLSFASPPPPPLHQNHHQHNNKQQQQAASNHTNNNKQQAKISNDKPKQ